MGGGRQIALACDCGFESNLVLVGQLLAHESLEPGPVEIVATFDRLSQRLGEHVLVLPVELQEAWESSAPGTSELEFAMEDFFSTGRERLRVKHGHLYSSRSETGPTELTCPACGTGRLNLQRLGNWIA